MIIVVKIVTVDSQIDTLPENKPNNSCTSEKNKIRQLEIVMWQVENIIGSHQIVLWLAIGRGLESEPQT